jgi:hypothetical protein
MADEDGVTLSPYAAAALAEFMKEQEEAQKRLEALSAEPSGAKLEGHSLFRYHNGQHW